MVSTSPTAGVFAILVLKELWEVGYWTEVLFNVVTVVDQYRVRLPGCQVSWGREGAFAKKASTVWSHLGLVCSARFRWAEE
jgi:hypothetical protein